MTTEATPGAEPTNNEAANANANPEGGASNAASQEPVGGVEPNSASGWDDETRAYIKKLREENATRRTKGKELEDRLSEMETNTGEFRKNLAKALGFETDMTPEEQVEQLTNNQHDLESQNFMLRTMIEYGITKDDSDYFQFLLTKKASELPEDGELGEDDLASIVSEVKARGVGSNAATSVSTQSPNGTAPAAGGTTDITPERFAKMNITEKSELFAKNPQVYNSLMGQVKEKGLLI